jgi:hypothetical protein
MLTNKHTTVHAPSLNIYWRRFEFHSQISIVPFLFLLDPKIAEISTDGADKVRRDLLTAEVNYADLDDSASQDDFLLAHPLHRHLLSWHTCPLHSAFLLIAMDKRTRGVNIITLLSDILEIVAAKVAAKTSPTPLKDTVNLHRS